MTEAPVADQTPQTSLDQWRPARLLGLVLLAPSLIMLVVGYVLPSVATLREGLGQPGAFDRLRSVDYFATYGFAGSVLVWPVVTVTGVALVVAYFANRAGWFARWLVRLTLVLPMVALAPTAFALGWRLDRVDPDAGTAEALVRSAVGFTMFGLLVGVGVTLYLATLRHRAQTRPGAATVVVALLAGLTTVAVGLQLYSYPTVLGSDPESAATPLVTVVELGFRQGDLAAGAAAAAVLLAALAVLGLVTVLLAIVTGLRIQISPVRREDVPEPGARRRPAAAGTFHGTKAAARHPEAVLGAILSLAVVLAVTLYGLWPWLSRLLQFRSADQTGQLLLNTWLPPLIGAVIGMVVAALAGFAIGALRPLGRFSPALLLLFAPWLFVGNGVLSIAEYQRLSDAGGADGFWSLVPPGWVVVPAVVVFTLLFRGQEPRWRELRQAGTGLGAATVRALIGPAMPMFWLVGAVTWLVQAQSLIWNQVTAAPDQQSGPLAALRHQQELAAAQAEPAIGLVLPFVVILAFAGGLALLQLTYLDRLTIRVGRAEPAPPVP
ncbi:hypothetical protein JQS43_24935 [Natronosporangium hydrolyticum]|uniref:Uncharacterized protein n=1 Tax=Natronosporangium hydrolyticum TaxID=2811111 RepID=A0A895YA93_9ACTN|nr:hypothetical protein [Natronosporangium hydrolyticum]QSB14667.1 hypothetical protein JQS43_24935 [Natronosporangium hydrolyticum]